MKKITNQQAYLLCDQFSMIIKSGISIGEGIEAMISETTEHNLKMILTQILKEINDHGSLYQAVKNIGVFDNYMVEMIRIGEKAGYLENVMTSLAKYYLRIDEMQSKIKDAIIYPSILVLTMLVVIGIIIFKVFPVFQTVFQSLGTDLSVYALGLMQIGNFLIIYGFWFILLLLVIIIITIVYYQYHYHEEAGIMFLSKFFITRKFMYEMSVAQFAYAFSLLIKSGYDSEEALKFIPLITSNKQLAKQIDQCLIKMDNGMDFKTVISESVIFKGIYTQMLILGIKIGRLDEIMTQVANLYEDEVNTLVNRFLDRIEPSLTAILAIIVGVILLSVMLPLLSIMSSLG